ncbi:MAG: glycosyltransferase family 4 protein [Candidatus Thiodiazotropha sp.]
MSLKILHTEWSEGWGGQEIRIVAESLALMKKGYQMRIACQPGSGIMRHAQEAGIPTVEIPMRKGLSLSTVRRTMRVIEEYGIDIVHTHSSVDAKNCGLAARLKGIPVVRSRHLSAPIKRSPLSKFVYMNLADCVITSGKAIRDRMVEVNRMDPERIFSAPAGVDVGRFRPDVDATEVKREFAIQADDFIVGIVAVIRTWKGHPYLVEAVKELIQRGYDLRLMIVGTGPYEPTLKQLVAELGIEDRVIFTGHRKDVPELIKAMSCLVLPSTKNEATSQVLPQAMAEKVPVVSSDAGGLAEVIPSREVGLLVPAADAGALADAIAWIHDHPQESRDMAEKGYAHCLEHFTFEKMIETTEAAYRFALRRSGN